MSDPHPITIGNTEDASTADLTLTPIVWVRQSFADDWQFRPDLVVKRFVSCAASQDLGTAELERRYGRIKYQWSAAFATVSIEDLIGWHLMIHLAGQAVWLGTIEAETRDVFGEDVASVPSGVQRFTAYEPLYKLRKIEVWQSYHERDGMVQQIGWIPSMNARDDAGRLIGNRSAAWYGTAREGSYLYGGTELWSHYDYCQYLLHSFVGWTWNVGGHADLLANMQTMIRFEAHESVASMLRKLIPKREGLDYRIDQDGDRFTLFVFPVVARDHTYGTATLARNPATVRIDNTGTANTRPSIRLVRTDEHRYGQVIVMGRRAVICCSLEGSAASLVKLWGNSLEGLYKAGTFNALDPALWHDQARADDRYRPVFSFFGAPADWDFNGGRAAPLIDWDGSVIQTMQADRQLQHWATLPWTPLREGWDYEPNPAVDYNPAGHEADFRPAAVWVKDPKTGRYVTAESVEMTVQTLRHAFGVAVIANPQHILAANHWSGANPTETDPVYDYDELAATIAFESDQRLVLGVALPGGDGTTLQIDADAHLWYMAPETIVRANEAGELVRSGTGGRILRTDAERLHAAMAGALARYYSERVRGDVTYRGLYPWYRLIGQILVAVDTTGDTETLEAPISGIEWVSAGKRSLTRILTGYPLQ